jgi:hypothetical protein
MLEITITSDQKIPVTAVPVTASGRAAALDGPLRVRVMSGNATFTQDPASPLTVMLVSEDVVAPGTVSDTVFEVDGDANLDPNVDEIIPDQVTLHVVSPKAAALGLVAGTAVLKP